jgi:hypothetical protein
LLPFAAISSDIAKMPICCYTTCKLLFLFSTVVVMNDDSQEGREQLPLTPELLGTIVKQRQGDTLTQQELNKILRLANGLTDGAVTLYIRAGRLVGLDRTKHYDIRATDA